MRFAIEIKGQVEIFNNDGLSGLIDNNVEFKVIGRVCDDKEYGDKCSTDCPAFCSGMCRSKVVRDITGKLWHVV